MRQAVCLCVLLLIGCSPKGASPLDAAAAASHPDLRCAPGTVAAGAAPPQGWEAWCVKPLATGTSVREGPSIQWHTNEARKAEGSYVADKQHGPWLYWYPTGTPQMQGSFASGVREGVWTSYHADGERASEGLYVDGNEHGTWTYWNTETLTRTEGEYILGGRDGAWIDYSADDTGVRERIYRNNRLVSQREL